MELKGHGEKEGQGQTERLLQVGLERLGVGGEGNEG